MKKEQISRRTILQAAHNGNGSDTPSCVGAARQPSVLAVWYSVYSPLEEKLLRLGLDPAAAEGEIINSAIAFFRSLRARGVDPSLLIRETSLALVRRSAASEIILRFGKYRGKRLGEVPSDYLRWCLASLRKLSPSLRRNMELVLKEAA